MKLSFKSMDRISLAILRAIILVCLLFSTITGLQASNQDSPADVRNLLRQVGESIHTDLQLADSLAQEALYISTALNNDSLMAHSFYWLGLISYYNGNFYCSSHYYERALETQYASEAPGFAENCWNNLGINYKLMSRYADASEAYYNSLRLAEQLGDSLSIYQTYINIGHLYDLLGQSSLGRQYLEQALRYFTEHNDAYHTALCYHNLGISESFADNMNASIRYLQKAVNIFSELESWHDLLKSYYDLATILLMQGRLNEAKLALDSVMQLSNDLNEEFWHAAGLMLMAEYYILRADYALAEEYLEGASDLLQFYQNDDKLKKLHTLKISLFAKSGQSERFEQSLAQLDSLTESLVSKRTDANIAQSRAIYELDKNLLEIEGLNNQLYFEKRAVRNRTLLALLAVLLSIVLLTLYMSIRRKKFALVKRNLELVNERKHNNHLLVASNVDMKVIPENNNGEQAENGKFLKLYHQVRVHIIKNKSYLNPDLNITDLAFALHTNEKYISRAIAAGSGTNFSTFINTFRVNEAKKLLSDNANNQLTGDQVADRCGFSNAHTCRRNFKKITGLNPLDFKNMSQREAD
jgi:AraC-like DNA-binding protein